MGGMETRLNVAEIGQPSGIAPNTSSAFGALTAPYVSVPTEPNPDLQFPESVRVYGDMGRTSTKVGGLLRALRLRILGLSWSLDATGVRPEVVDFVTEQIGLTTAPGSRRTRGGIRLTDHMEEALSFLQYGFAAFEQVYQPAVPDTDAERATGLPHVLRLRKLGSRDQTTVSRIGVDADGGLVEIGQYITDRTTGMTREVAIPVGSLVMYVNDKRGADWYGQSILREAYRDWFFMDRLERLQAQIVERNGMGVPVVEYDPATPDAKKAAEAMARGFRAGATAGGAVPMGTKVTLVGVSGSTVDPLPAISHHDQQIGKAMLAMFMDLGHDAGARSLGDTFVDLFNSAIDTTARRIADTFTDHVIRDLVALNFGDGEAYPTLGAAPASSSMSLSADVLKTLSESGAVEWTEEDEAKVRAQYGLPKREGPRGGAPTGGEESADLTSGLDADDFTKLANASGALIRSGFDPEASLRAAGLPSIKHLGLLPVPGQRPDTTDGDMPDGSNIPPAEDEDDQEAPHLSGAESSVMARTLSWLRRARP